MTFLGRLLPGVTTPTNAPPAVRSNAGTPSPIPYTDEDDDKFTDVPSGHYGELPVFGVPPPDRAFLIDNVLASFERGQFRDAALLADSMMRDDRVVGVLDTLIESVLGCEVAFNPADDSAEASDLADDMEQLWPRMFGRAELAELLRWGALLNFGLGELKWKQDDDGGWVPKLKKVWHPQFIYWNWTTKRYDLITEQGTVPIIVGDPRWLIYTPSSYERAWMHGKIRSLAKPWMIRQWTYADWAHWCEIHGHPIRVLITPAEADERKKKALAGQLANIGSNTSIAVPQGSKESGNVWDVKLVEATAVGYEGFDMLLSKAEVSIAVDLLGQNLTTEVKGGSRAAAQVHDNVRADVLRFRATTLADACRECVLEPHAAFNLGDAELAARPEWETDPPEDESTRADVILKLSQAVSSLSQARVDVFEMLEEFGLPMLEPGAEPQMAPPVQLPAPGQPPHGAPTDAEGEKKPAQQAPQKQAQMRAAPRLRMGYIKGQGYADRLAAKAKRKAARVMAPDLKELYADIRSAHSPDDLRARLVARMRHFNPSALADAVAKTRILADLAGRHSLLEDV
jgi:phage gp29-like protein